MFGLPPDYDSQFNPPEPPIPGLGGDVDDEPTDEDLEDE